MALTENMAMISQSTQNEIEWDVSYTIPNVVQESTTESSTTQYVSVSDITSTGTFGETIDVSTESIPSPSVIVVKAIWRTSAQKIFVAQRSFQWDENMHSILPRVILPDHLYVFAHEPLDIEASLSVPTCRAQSAFVFQWTFIESPDGFSAVEFTQNSRRIHIAAGVLLPSTRYVLRLTVLHETSGQSSSQDVPISVKIAPAIARLLGNDRQISPHSLLVLDASQSYVPQASVNSNIDGEGDGDGDGSLRLQYRWTCQERPGITATSDIAFISPCENEDQIFASLDDDESKLQVAPNVLKALTTYRFSVMARRDGDGAMWGPSDSLSVYTTHQDAAEQPELNLKVAKCRITDSTTRWRMGTAFCSMKPGSSVQAFAQLDTQNLVRQEAFTSVQWHWQLQMLAQTSLENLPGDETVVKTLEFDDETLYVPASAYRRGEGLREVHALLVTVIASGGDGEGADDRPTFRSETTVRIALDLPPVSGQCDVETVEDCEFREVLGGLLWRN